MLAFVLPFASISAQEDDPGNDDDLTEFLPGLAAEYIAAEGAVHERRDPVLQFVWLDRSPDQRLPPGPFTACWRGRLFAMVPGEYRLRLYVAGEATLSLGSKLLVDSAATAPSPGKPRWLEAPPVDLEYGYHPLEVTFRKTGHQAQLGLFWAGPQFELEPVPDRHLFHDPQLAPDERFDQGRLLSRALRCAACHDVPAEQSALPAPALSHLSGNVSPNWLVDWIHEPARKAGDSLPMPGESSPWPDELRGHSPMSRMPDFGLTRAQASAIAGLLLASSKGAPDAAPPQLEGNRQSGETLFQSLGCLACHRAGGLGSTGLFAGGDLSSVADKRPADFFSRWLRDPAATNPSHRMPVFRLDDQEQADLAAYLMTLEQPAGSESQPDQLAEILSQADTGRQLVQQYRCGACHLLPEMPVPAPLRRVRLDAAANWQNGCLGEPDVTAYRPGYRLSAAGRESLQAYFTNLAHSASHKPSTGNHGSPIDGALILAERNCLGCHARGPAAGISTGLNALADIRADLAPAAGGLPALSPPSLTGVGDKLHTEALEAAVLQRTEPLRPWLAVRMPRYNLAADESRALVQHLIDSDRIPEDESNGTPDELPDEFPDDAALALAGSRLVTSEGFGCTSCHAIGNSVPVHVQLAAQGTTLSQLAQRIRRPWYDRWVRNPARIVPRMEMPSIQQPIRGVLGDDLDRQLAAVWQVLNQPGFNPPQPNPVRVVRARHLSGLEEPAAALTDVLEVGERIFIRPLVIGLSNRHNILFDFETNHLSGWWIGDAARQRTRGKSWYWEPGGTDVIPPVPSGGESELQVMAGGQSWQPQIRGQFTAELDWYEQIPDGLRFGYRLRFGEPVARFDDSSPGNPSQRPGPVFELLVKQSFTALAEQPDTPHISGFRRRIEIEGVPAGHAARLSAIPGGGFTLAADGRSAELSGAPGRPQVRLLSPENLLLHRPDGSGEVAILLESEGADQTLRCELEYLIDLPLDRFPVDPPPLEPPAPTRLEAVPGYRADRLPLPPSEMPTGLAWRDDGTLVFSSLKGSVWLARDSDGDGLEDQQTLFCDGLAAPYGVASHGAAVDVINKHALLRLVDTDGDGQANRTDVVASGWGYTADYHDWAVGLPRDDQGNYFIGLPCQQDERNPAAAVLRGTALKLAPREPSPDDPRSYRIEPLCAGLRFPMGLALGPRGELFATDNQGNYNPFNELNHLLPGARYGFINRLEASPDFQPPSRDPAIDIPHPWTRSINGICFLHTPREVQTELGHDLFGPFEGHLVGCEYDTRRLIRMSLQAVGDTYQGAVYPFSVEPATGEETFEGPVVCEVAPDGDLYVGNLRDSGWGGGQNTGSIVRLRPQGDLPCGIAEVRAWARGFTIDFTRAVSLADGGRAGNYAVSSYRRIPTPAYGGPDVDRQTATVERVELSLDGRQATLILHQLRPGHVYEFRLRGLAPPDEAFFPAEAHYTLRQLAP